jgi:nicotinamide-nucleotide amidase
MNAELIAIGSELLLGETVDTNSAYLARQLAGIGVGLFRKTVVGDNLERIAATIAEALGRADLVICTGGLGPTVDDMTRDAVALALGRPLEFQQHLLDQIEARFRAFGRPMSESNRRQAYVPAGARIIENPRGTAPAFIAEDPRGTVAVLPGVPFEMRYLWEHALLPYLRDERGQTGIILVRTLHAAGLSESRIGELVADLMEQDNPTLGISAKRAQYELRIGARAASRAAAEALADQAEATIRARIGEYLIGGRAVLRGAMIHPLDRPADDEAAVSLARSGAFAAREQWRSHVALGVQPASNAGPDGFTLVAVALAHDTGIAEAQRRFDLRGDEGWEFVGTLALDVLRQHLLGG